MSIARSSTLKNKYYFVTVAIDDSPGGQPEGMMYHASRTKDIPFSGILELAWEIDSITRGRNYPMRSAERRSLSGRRGRAEQDLPYLWLTETDSPESCTKRAAFWIFLQSRYCASRQGVAAWEDTGRQVTAYRSFPELMRIINEFLAVRVSVPEHNSILNFESMKELTGKLDTLFAITENRTDTIAAVYRKKRQTVTYFIRLLFYENKTYQGSVSRRKTGERRHFRSFLELLMMIDENIRDSVVWAKEHKQAMAL